MPINPSIALSGQAPQVQDPLEAYARVMSLKNLMQQRQANQMTLEMNKQKMEQMRQAARDNEAVQQILLKHSGDVEKAKPELLATMGERAIPMLQSYAQYEGELSKLDNEKRKQLREGYDFLGKTMKGIASIPDENARNVAYQNTVGNFVQSGVLPQEIAQMLPFTYDSEIFSLYANDLERKKEKLDMELAETNLESKKQDIAFKAFEERRKQAEEKRKEELHPLEMLSKEKTATSPASDKSVNEREIELRMKASLTEEEKRELKAIEDTKYGVAKQYGAGYYTMTSPEGQTIFVHKGLGNVNPAPGGMRPQYTAEERTQISQLDEIITQSEMLRDLAKKNKDSIGIVQGRVAAAKRLVTGAGQEVNDMFRIADNMADMLLRARSGAQINEQEYKRLRTLVPNPRFSEEKFFSDLDSFQAEVKRLLARRSGQAPIVTPEGGGQPAGNVSRGAPKTAEELLNKYRGK